MAAIVAPPTLPAERAVTPPPSHLVSVGHPPRSVNTSQRGAPAPVPNKHIPFCSPGPRPSSRSQHQLETPPASPPSPTQLIETSSITHPPHGFNEIFQEPPVYAITADKLSHALDHLASQPLPVPSQVFPWMHGLHAENQLQLAFFIARKRSLRRTPKCIRGLTIIKAGGDLSHSKLKGAISPDEILQCATSKTERRRDHSPAFLDADPRDGFSVRNFQIQACKMATVSDIVVYGDDQTPRQEVVNLAKRIAKAQTSWQKKMEVGSRLFNTFVLFGK